jgi:glucokinase
MKESDAPSLMRNVERLTPRIINEFCQQGDEMAIEVFRRTGEIFGMGLANYASLINPQAIILTGGISHAGKWLLDPTRQAFEDNIFGNMKGRIKILVSQLNDRERDVLGASALAWEVPEYSLFK